MFPDVDRDATDEADELVKNDKKRKARDMGTSTGLGEGASVPGPGVDSALDSTPLTKKGRKSKPQDTLSTRTASPPAAQTSETSAPKTNRVKEAAVGKVKPSSAGAAARCRKPQLETVKSLDVAQDDSG